MLKQALTGIAAGYRKISAGIAGGALLVICLSLIFQIAARLIGLKSSGWTVDITQTAMVWLTGAGGGLLASQNALLKLDLFIPHKAKKAFISVIVLFIGAMFMLAGLKAAAGNWNQSSPVIKIPMAFNYLAFVWTGMGIVLSGLPIEKNTPVLSKDK